MLFSPILHLKNMLAITINREINRKSLVTKFDLSVIFFNKGPPYHKLVVALKIRAQQATMLASTFVDSSQFDVLGLKGSASNGDDVGQQVVHNTLRATDALSVAGRPNRKSVIRVDVGAMTRISYAVT